MAADRVSFALLGAGLFATDAYVPLFRDHQDSTVLKAFWSRSEASAQSVKEAAKDYAPDAAVYHGEDGLAELLESGVVKAVVLVLPPAAMLKIAQQCLAAGIHVLQEKPISTDVASSLPLLEKEYDAVWSIAENYRFETVFQKACDRVKQLGRVIKMDLIADMPMNRANKYFSCGWRRDAAQLPAAFMGDVTVHFIAALRMLAAAAGAGEAEAASGYTSHAQPELPGPDSMVGVLRFANGMPATFSCTVACQTPTWSLSVVGTEGTLDVRRGGWGGSRGAYTLYSKVASEEGDFKTEEYGFRGLDNELDNFVALVRGGADVSPQGRHLASPHEGARDLAIVEALMASSEAKGALVPVQAVPS